jgi:hypothetical protein
MEYYIGFENGKFQRRFKKCYTEGVSYSVLILHCTSIYMAAIMSYYSL